MKLRKKNPFCFNEQCRYCIILPVNPQLELTPCSPNNNTVAASTSATPCGGRAKDLTSWMSPLVMLHAILLSFSF